MPDDEIQLESEEQSLPQAPEPRAKARRLHWSLNIIGIAGILALCYYGEAILAVMLISMLLAFVLAPVVDFLAWLHLPRGLGAFVAILLLLTAMMTIVYYSYNKAVVLVQDLPKYTTRLREDVMRFSKQAESLESLGDESEEKDVIKVRTATGPSDLLTRGFGSAGTLLLACSFVPFLTFFMLTWQQHVRSATVMLFPLESRNTVYVTLGLISAMIRSFMVGNVLIGLALGAVSTLIFGLLHLPFFYFVGFISGFLSLVPYMGLLLAIVPPVFVGLGHIEVTDLITIVVTVLGLHMIALNVLYPKFLGNRLQLNPLAVTMSLLVWGSLWGAMGLLLAIPITGAMKIVFDHVESLKPYGAWLGE
jgi:predicted PurR-regulated permease PerM